MSTEVDDNYVENEHENYDYLITQKANKIYYNDNKTYLLF